MKYDELNIDRVRNEFSLLAEELSLLYPDETFEVFVVGGVPLMEYTHYKKSSDIDIYTLSDKRLLPLLEHHFMNTRAAGMSMSFSADMESRFILSDFSKDNLLVYFASLEDIVASKLIANRDKDFEDITDKNVIKSVDFGKLDSIVKDELSIDLSEHNYRQLLRVYEKYLEYADKYIDK